MYFDRDTDSLSSGDLGGMLVVVYAILNQGSRRRGFNNPCQNTCVQDDSGIVGT